MLFEVLAETFERLEGTSSRITLTSILASLFKKADPDDIDKVIYFIQGSLWPSWYGEPEIGISEKLLIKSISLATGFSENEVENLYKKLGDLGRVAENLKIRKTQSTALTRFISSSEKKLTVSDVHSTLVKIARMTGEGSRDLKIRTFVGLLQQASPKEAKYIVRFVEGRLRLGVGDATIIEALAVALGGGESSKPVIEKAYNIRADLGEIGRILIREGIEKIKIITPSIGIPVRPMLAERLSDPREILDKVGGKGIAEFKYDGERAQIHKKDDNVIIFSRRLENISHQYPDVIEMSRKYIKAREAIVEGEIVALDPDTGEYRPFQELMHRKRKHDISKIIEEYPVAVRLFDILYVDGVSLVDRPLIERREYLIKYIEQRPEFSIAEYKEISDPDELEKFFLKSLEEGNEGLVIKSLSGIYQAGARGWLWIKYKRDYKSEMIDTVDLVLVGGFYGRGKRGGKIGTALLAAYDPEKDVFRTICKVGSGFSDSDLIELNKRIEQTKISHRHPRVVSEIEPDVWTVPKYVMEVIGAELTLSPLHTCCLDSVRKGVGISIRFPRFIRWRDDKNPEDATTEKELLEMYFKQLKKIETEQTEKTI
ncbi:MAG: ATP-dependent DNA ligase [Desulfurococcales archaeon]|jgi:DNA ligase-1|nr:ATP-dependent DNA ligase [Desulfurococcales archaeon]